MNTLSLFDGASCGQIALERANIKVDSYLSSEIDKYAIQTTQKNYPNTIQLGDVQTMKMPKNDIDLLIGGSPCQGFSFAGNQLNFVDPRSRLFFDYVRVMDKVKPQYFLLENTPMKKEYQSVISSYLGVEPITINSSLVSAQSRKRLYWTNIPNITQPEDKGILLSDILEDEVDDKYYISTERAIEICDREVKEGKIQKLGYVGNDVQSSMVYSIHGKSVTLKALGGGWGGKTGLYWIPCIDPNRVNKRQQGQRFKPSNAKYYTLLTADKHGVLTKGRIRLLTSLECERLQTMPDNYTEGVSEAQRKKMIGNGFTVDIIAHILKNIK